MGSLRLKVLSLVRLSLLPVIRPQWQSLHTVRLTILNNYNLSPHIFYPLAFLRGGGQKNTSQLAFKENRNLFQLFLAIPETSQHLARLGQWTCSISVVFPPLTPELGS